MGAALLLLLQAATASPPERIDLLQPVATPGCQEPAGEEIVVCGGPANPYRIAPRAEGARPTPVPKAEIGLFGGKAAGAVETEAAQVPNGAQSSRLMARIRLPL